MAGPFEGLAPLANPSTFGLLYPAVISLGVGLFAWVRLPPRPVVSILVLSVWATCAYQLRAWLFAVSIDPTTALFWHQCFFWAPALMAASGLHFMALLDEASWARSRAFLIAVYGGVLAILVAHQAQLIQVGVQATLPFGYVLETSGPLDLAQRIYGAACILGVLGLAGRYFVRWRHHPVRGPGAKVLAGSLALSMTAALLTVTRVAALPLFELSVPLFHLGLLFTVRRHDLLSFSIEQTARPVLDALAEGLLVVDAEGAVLHANSRARELYGEPIAGASLLRGPLAEGVAAALEGRALQGAAVQLGDVESLASFAPVEEHGRRRVVISLTDVRPLRAVERGLMVAREDALSAQAAAETANRAKSTFLENMSHELRTPLNAIIGYAELLADDAEDDAVEDLGRIVHSGRYLLRLLDDVLDLSKLDAGRVDLVTEVFDVDEALAEIRPAVEVLAQLRGNRIDLDVGRAGWVLADPIRVRQILLNLLSNATKFTENGSITVRTHTAGAQIAIQVADSGIGMDAEQLGRLFNRFEQVHRQSHAEYGGTGLGLALSRDLARLMDGDLLVTSEPGKGSTFTLLLLKASRTGGSTGRRKSLVPSG